MSEAKKVENYAVFVDEFGMERYGVLDIYDAKTFEFRCGNVSIRGFLSEFEIRITPQRRTVVCQKDSN